MATYTTSPRPAFLEWCQVHAPVFWDHWAQIGLRKTQAESFKFAAASAAAALLAAEQARQAALVATQQVEQAFATLAAQAGDAVRGIRAFAGTSADPARVYSLAQVPPAASPSPVPPPGRPSGLTVQLDATTGSLTLRWKATNPTSARGTTYIIRRKLPGETEFAFIGVSGKKRFVDETLMLGAGVREGILAPGMPAPGMLAPAVQYTVQGQRANLSGPVSPIFTVNFGKLPSKDAAMVANVTTQAATSSTQTATPDAWNVEIPAARGNGRAKAPSR